jgi:transketolase
MYKNIESKIINILRILSVDMIEKAISGHSEMPLGFVPMMFVLWCKIMNFNQKYPLWKERDRFIFNVIFTYTSVPENNQKLTINLQFSMY